MLLIIESVIIKCILLPVFHMKKKTARKITKYVGPHKHCKNIHT